MSQLNVDTIKNRLGTSGPTLPGATFTGNIVGTAATFSGNVSIAGTLTYEDVTNVDSVGLITARSGIRVDAGGLVVTGISTFNSSINVSGISTFNNDIQISGIVTAKAGSAVTFTGGLDISNAVETVSVGSTYDLGDGKVILECNAQNGTVFTHNLTSGNVGIVSLRNFPVTKNSVTTFTILFTQNATGTGNTTAATGIGTNITLTPLGVSGFTTSARVATASTVTLSETASDIDIVSLAIHYNGSGTGDVGNYRVFATGNTGFRFGSVGF